MLIILEVLKLDRPFLTDWVEDLHRAKLVVRLNEFHSGIERGKKEDR